MKKIVKRILAYFGFELRRIQAYKKEEWAENLPWEAAYWEKVCQNLQNEDSEDYKMARDPDSKLQDFFLKYINKSQSAVKILDVGAGPLTRINKKCDLAKIEITAVDPLADNYNEMLDKYKIQPLVRTQKCDGEKLSEKFPVNSFDITYSRNALDHSYDPVKCIEEMVKVTKSQHFIIIQIHENEACHLDYATIHQWNFSIRNEKLFGGNKIFCLNGRDLSKKINLGEHFKNTAPLVDLNKENRFITAVFKKL